MHVGDGDGAAVAVGPAGLGACPVGGAVAGCGAVVSLAVGRDGAAVVLDALGRALVADGCAAALAGPGAPPAVVGTFTCP